MLYPIMLDLKGKSCIVFGGGEVAERKLRGILECGAEAVVVSPDLNRGLQQLYDAGAISWIKDYYKVEYIKDAMLCFACTNDSKVNAQIAEQARERKILVNVADAASAGSFSVPAVRRRGDIILSVYCDENPGASRYLAGELVTGIEGWQEEYITLIKGVRSEVKAIISDTKKRQDLIKLLYTQPYEELAKRDIKAFKIEINKLLKQHSEVNSHE